MKPAPYIDCKGTQGIKNTKDSLRQTIVLADRNISSDSLRIANNIDIDMTGMVSRRKGYSMVNQISCHSLKSFIKANTRLVVANGDLNYLDNNDVLNEIRPGMSDNPVCYYEDGDTIFLTDEVIIGYVRNNIYYGFTPVTTGRTKQHIIDYFDASKANIPAGHLIAWWNARLFVAKDNILFFTDPLAYNRMTTKKNFIQFNGKITLLAPVRDGIWVADTLGVHFLNGNTVGEFNKQTKIYEQAYLYSQYKIPTNYMNKKYQFEIDAWMVITRGGPAMLGEGGKFYLYTDYLPPLATAASGGFHTLTKTSGAIMCQYYNIATTSNGKIVSVINTENTAISEYTNLDINTLASWNNFLYSASGAGLMKFNANKDANTNIDATIKFPTFDVCQGTVRRLREAWIVKRCDGEMKVDVYPDESTSDEYALTIINSQVHDERRKFAKGYKERTFGFGLRNYQGSYFEMDSIRFQFETVSHRVR